MQILTQYRERNFRNTVGVRSEASEREREKKKKANVFLRPRILTQKLGVGLKIYGNDCTFVNCNPK